MKSSFNLYFFGQTIRDSKVIKFWHFNLYFFFIGFINKKLYIIKNN